MIKGNENICATFNIFHDGCISHYEYVENDLKFEIEIMYLAKRVNPDYRKFWLTLQNAHSMVFLTWPNDHNAQPEYISNLIGIFEPDLEL